MKSNFFKNEVNNRIAQTIPKGYFFKEGTVDTGYVIQDEDGNEYVYVSEGYNAEGIYVRGFWVSRFEISKGKYNAPKSIMGEKPWVHIDYNEAKRVAKSIRGDLFSGEEYSRLCKWFVETNVATFNQVYGDGVSIENCTEVYTLAKTGLSQGLVCNNIYDFFRNGYIWTNEKSELYEHYRIIRGGHNQIYNNKNCYSPINRCWASPNEKHSNLTFRIVLSDKDSEYAEE